MPDNQINIAIHGIGNPEPDYYLRWKIAENLELPPERVIAFWYEDLLEADKLNLLVKLGIKMASTLYLPTIPTGPVSDVVADYLNDILVFFLSRKAAERIESKLLDLVDGYESVRIFGHSLGSVIAYWFVMNHPELAPRIDLVTLGSPLGGVLSRLVKARIKRMIQAPIHPTARPLVKSWVNIHSDIDPISGEIRGLGCALEDQYEIKLKGMVRHVQVDRYVKYYKLATEGARE